MGHSWTSNWRSLVRCFLREFISFHLFNQELDLIVRSDYGAVV